MPDVRAWRLVIAHRMESDLDDRMECMRWGAFVKVKEKDGPGDVSRSDDHRGIIRLATRAN